MGLLTYVKDHHGDYLLKDIFNVPITWEDTLDLFPKKIIHATKLIIQGTWTPYIHVHLDSEGIQTIMAMDALLNMPNEGKYTYKSNWDIGGPEAILVYNRHRLGAATWVGNTYYPSDDLFHSTR